MWHTAIEYLKAHWGWFLSIGIPFTVALCTLVVSRYGDPDNDPKTPPPKWVMPFVFLGGLLTFVVELLSAKVPPGKISVFGTSTWTLPGLPSWTPDGPPKMPIPPPRQDDRGFIGVRAMLIVGALGLVLAACLAGCLGAQIAALKVANAAQAGDSLAVKAVRDSDHVIQDKLRARYKAAATEPEIAAIDSELAAHVRRREAAYDGLEALAAALHATGESIAAGKVDWLGLLDTAQKAQDALTQAGVTTVDLIGPLKGVR